MHVNDAPLRVAGAQCPMQVEFAALQQLNALCIVAGVLYFVSVRIGYTGSWAEILRNLARCIAGSVLSVTTNLYSMGWWRSRARKSSYQAHIEHVEWENKEKQS